MPGTVASPGGETAAAPETEPSLAPSIKARMDELTAEKWSKHREAAAAEARARIAEQGLAEANARLAAYGAAGQQPMGAPLQAPHPSGRETAAEIEARAQELARSQMFNEKCADVYRNGCSQFPDFQTKLGELNRMVGGNLPREFVEAALATGKAHEAIYKVASDPSIADRVMTMTPYQQVVEMDRLVRGGAAQQSPPLSGAPRPISPQVGMRGTAPMTTLEDENLPMEDWIKLREKDLKDRGVHPRLA
jgi:hypothetical protein